MAEAEPSEPTDVNTLADDKHFVDKHQFELINRVSNIVIILNELLCENVIDQQSYDEIRALHTSHEKMMALFSGPLKSRGVQGKDIFYKILTIYEPRLTDDLERMAVHEDIITAKEMLFEMLNDLNFEELEEFKSLIVLERGFPPMSRKRLKMLNVQGIVKLMVETYSQECLILTKKVLKKMNRTDLVRRLSDISSEIEEEHPVAEQQLSLIQRVERMASVIELLLATLADLSDRDFEKFDEILNRIHFHGYYSNISLRLLKTADMQDIVFLMVQNFGQQSVEKTKTVLDYMNRNDLVQRLSHGSSGPQKKYSVDEQLPVLIHKVATMAAIKELLLETLNDLTSEELKNFKWFLQFTFIQRSLQHILWEQMQEANTAEVLVDVLVKIRGQKSVDVSMKVLMDMNRTDLVQRLSESSSGLRGSSAEACGLSTAEGERNSLYEHWPALIQKAKTMASLIELLLKTLKHLSERELRNYKDLILGPTDMLRFFSNTPVMLDKTNLQDIVFIMVQKFGQQALEKTKVCLQQMRRTDLVQRLSRSSSGRKKKHSADKRCSSLIKRVATVAAVKQLLLETLNYLSNKQFGEFKRFLHLIASQKNLPDIFRMLSYTEDSAYTVDEMMQAYGQQSVELTRDILKKMNRIDLVQSLALPSTGLKVEHSVDEHQHVLFERAAAKKILLETLKDLSPKELKKFKWLMQFTYFQRSLPQIPWSQLDWIERPDTLVDLMMKSHGQQSVEVTKDVFMDMNRTDLVQRLSETSSGLKVHQEVSLTSLHMKLLETLEDLDDERLEEFKLHLQRTAIKEGFKRIPSYRMRMAGTAEIVMLMVEMYGEQSLEVTREVLEYCDLVQRFSNIGLGSKVKPAVDEDQPAQRKREVTMTSLHKKLLETLEQLSKGDLEKFKHVLLYSKMKESLPRIPRQIMEVSDRSEIVEVMVEIYGQQSVEVTREVFMKMNRSDLVQRLSDVISSGSKGSSRWLNLESCGSLMDSSGWTKLEPEVSSTDADEAPTYSLQSEAGSFECSVSGLRWFCKGKVSFKYQFCSWEEPMERMERMQYMPAGPLIDITVIAGKLDEVYLPHWICIDDSPKISNKFAVLHINNCGDDVEKVSEVTTSHVKLSEPVFSPKAALMKVGIPVKINCNVLIYKTNTAFLTLHVYLVPRDPGLQQAMDKRNLSYGYKIIRKPHPEMSLKLRDRFILTADLNDAKIAPENLKLRYETPNFFEVYIENPDRDFTLNLTQRNEAQPVWTREIREGEYQSTGLLQGEHFVDKHRCDLIERVSNIGPILDNLLSRDVIEQEVYDTIRAIPTTQEKMRTLYCGPLKAGGPASKDIFYTILEEKESYLVADLKRKEA